MWTASPEPTAGDRRTSTRATRRNGCQPTCSLPAVWKTPTCSGRTTPSWSRRWNGWSAPSVPSSGPGWCCSPGACRGFPDRGQRTRRLTPISPGRPCTGPSVASRWLWRRGPHLRGSVGHHLRRPLLLTFPVLLAVWAGRARMLMSVLRQFHAARLEDRAIDGHEAVLDRGAADRQPALIRVVDDPPEVIQHP